MNTSIFEHAPEPNQIVLMQYNKQDQDWYAKPLTVTDLNDEATRDRAAMAYMLATPLSCCHCTAPGTHFNRMDMRCVDPKTKKERWVYALVRNCLSDPCREAAKAHLTDLHATNTMVANSMRYKCATCQELFAEIQRCAQCHGPMYCSTACQRADWPKHKPMCTARKDTDLW